MAAQVDRPRDQQSEIKQLIIKVVKNREKGEMYSPTLREIFRVHHGVTIGMYTHGGCFRPFSSSAGASAFADLKGTRL